MKQPQGQNSNWVTDLEAYGLYHQSKANLATHMVGIPLIIFSIFCFLGWFRFFPLNIPLSAGTIFFLGLFYSYYRIHKKLAIAVFAWCCPLFMISEEVSVMPFLVSLFISLGAFLVGWGFQLIGHSFEKNSPAFLKDLLHLWRGPLYITYEAMKKLDIKV